MLPVERLFFTRFLEQIRTLMVQKKNRRTNRVRGELEITNSMNKRTESRLD
jgi:hypothetical protein